MELAVLIWLACGVISAVLAANKGRNPLGWGLIGFFLGPLGLIAAAAMPDTKSNPQVQEWVGLQHGYLKKCPMCAEAIKVDAKICRFCGASAE